MTLVTLRIIDGADRGRMFENIPTPVTIGREEGNTIQLNDERISRFHLKIQVDKAKYILTDLDSTNGTKVNGEDVQLRILRFGDVISLGRSVLLFGNREQIAGRLRDLRDGSADEPPDSSDEDGPTGQDQASLDAEINWSDDPDIQKTLHTLFPPELPEELSPGQAAQLSELLDFLHIRVRDLIASVKIKGEPQKVLLEVRQWQNLLDLQDRLALYLRGIGEPHRPPDPSDPSES